MLIIHKPLYKKLFFLVITSIGSVGALLGLSALTYTPELSHAETVDNNETRSLADITYMQQMNPQVCANSPLNTQFTLTDSRDGETYTVARIKNQTNDEAYCWMTQNLRLTDYTLTSADSNVSEPYVLPVSTTLSTDDDPAQFSETDVYESKVYYDPSHPEYGAYYNWYTATASTGNASLSVKGENAPSSVCPIGWHLPTGNTNGEFNSLTKGQVGNDIIRAPYNFVYGGSLTKNSLSSTRYNGGYWSPTVFTSDAAFILGYSTNTLSADIGNSYYTGRTIRCIADHTTTTLSDATYMQELTTGMCERSAENESKQLIDSRDGKSYWVTKLKDGNCWMTQNLDLDISAEGLKTEDTDISKDWNSASDYPPEATQIAASPDFGTTNNNIKSWDPGIKYCNTSGCNLTASVNNGHDAQGNYYSWGAATAGQAVSLTSTTDEQSTQSICPKGWRLPLSGSSNNTVSGSFYNLVNNLSIEQIVTNPYYYVYSGYVNDTSLGLAGVNGYYSSSSAHGDELSYTLRFGTFDNHIVPSDNLPRYFGLSVRCVLRDNIPDYNNNVTIAVNPTISLDVANEVVVEKGETNPSNANLDVKVISNQKYSVGISAKDPNLTSATSDVEIPAKSGLLNITENGWGIKLKNDAEFTAITSNLQTFYTASGAEIKTIPFTIGISTAPDLPNGEYSTDITVTATQN